MVGAAYPSSHRSAASSAGKPVSGAPEALGLGVAPFERVKIDPSEAPDPGAGRSARGMERPEELTAIVEYEIIPRLMLAHSIELGRRDAPVDGGMEIDADMVRNFAHLSLTTDPDRMLVFVVDLLSSGHGMDSVYLKLLAPAARLLGAYWDDDIVSYADVTIGLGRLQQMIRLLGWKMPPGKDLPDSAHAALFSPAPGEQHIFGLIMVEDSFRRSGWRTWIETNGDLEPVADTVSRHWFDVVGFSLSNETLADRLADAVRLIRTNSRNRDLLVLVGGRAVENDPALLSWLGADATAADGGQALTLAQKRVSQIF